MKEFHHWYTEEVERLAEICKEETIIETENAIEEEETEEDYWESVMFVNDDLN